jgi:prepilin-type N-terminal cleavage/methylation domain-containing protein
MLKNIKKRNEGFTIIEVLIVLAIAGLILLIVFLAVPALQRNSRNTQRRTDAGNYLSAVNEFISNNAGKIPSGATNAASIKDLTKMSSLTAPTDTVAGARSDTVAVDAMELVTGAKCDPANPGNTIGGSTRQVAIRYGIENSSGGSVKQCLDS